MSIQTGPGLPCWQSAHARSITARACSGSVSVSASLQTGRAIDTMSASLIAELAKPRNGRGDQMRVALYLSGQYDERDGVGECAEHAVQRIDTAIPS